MPVVVISAIMCVCMILLVVLKPSAPVGKRGFVLPLYPLAPLAGAILLLALGLISPASVAQGMLAPTDVNPIKILVLFLSMTLISVFLDNTGFFSYLAMKALERSGGSQKKLLLTLYVVVSVLTVFTSNDIIVLTFTPFICYFAKNAKINPIPYLVSEFVAANTWSMALIIGNPTNIYLSGSAGVTFMDYICVMALPTVLAGFASLCWLLFAFRKLLRGSVIAQERTEIHLDTALMKLGLFHLLVCIALMTVSSYVALPMWLASLGCFLSLYGSAAIYLLVKKRPFTPIFNSLKRTPYEIIPFILSMFVIVLALSETGVTVKIAGFLTQGSALVNFGVTSMLTANLVNNIPMSVLFSAIIDPLTGVQRTQALFAAVVGSNLGAFLTPLGALAGIMWTGMLKNYNLKLSFVNFVKYCAPAAMVAMLASLIGLALVL